ncbi:hypothetical protein AAFF_G00232650 [Aldrovandia affinis]|uniref:Uncharacterized protein n=1 Tax=Aldrovandia affinis TaxID=143900 RepID=A0AAD7RF70_9TELE|nr:hypothetical protein AAFF_G00232650 [Aldrovandia affinis]
MRPAAGRPAEHHGNASAEPSAPALGERQNRALTSADASVRTRGPCERLSPLTSPRASAIGRCGERRVAMSRGTLPLRESGSNRWGRVSPPAALRAGGKGSRDREQPASCLVKARSSSPPLCPTERVCHHHHGDRWSSRGSS